MPTARRSPPIRSPSSPSSSKHPLRPSGDHSGTGTDTGSLWQDTPTRGGPAPPACCRGSEGPALTGLQATREPEHSPGTDSQGPQRSGSCGAGDLASHAVKCFCAGARDPEATLCYVEEQTVERATSAARKHSLGGRASSSTSWGQS